MLPLLSALCAAAVLWFWSAPRTPEERLARLRSPALTYSLPTPGVHGLHDPTRPTGEEPHHPAWLHAADPRSRALTRRTVGMAAVIGLLSGLLTGGYAGIIVGLLATLAAGWCLHRQEPDHVREERQRIATDLPFAADLMTACLLAGRPVGAATEIAAHTVGGPLGHRLIWVSTQLRLGADPEPTWAVLAADPSTGQLARAMSRAAQSGAPVADVLTRVADDAREASRAAAVASARSVGVKAVAPLGLCFLPAFVLLGIIPVIAGLASTIVLP